MTPRYLLSFLLHALFLASVVSRRNDRNQFHGHKGKLSPHAAGLPKAVKLSPSDRAKLEKGGTVMKQEKSGAGGGAICVQDVQAPAEAVWFQILDLPNYHKKVSKVKESKNYVVSKQRDGTIKIKTKQVLGVLPGYSYESYYDHTFHPNQSSLTWNLDYDKTSDFDDVSGHWHVQPLSAQTSRVYYACDISMKGAVPGPIMNYITKAALKQATAWVKKESEANTEKTMPKEYGQLPAKMKTFATTSSTSTTSESQPQRSRRWGWGFPKMATE